MIVFVSANHWQPMLTAAHQQMSMGGLVFWSAISWLQSGRRGRRQNLLISTSTWIGLNMSGNVFLSLPFSTISFMRTSQQGLNKSVSVLNSNWYHPWKNLCLALTILLFFSSLLCGKIQQVYFNIQIYCQNQGEQVLNNYIYMYNY